MSLQRRIVTSHESPSRSSSPPPLSQSRRLAGGPSSSKGEYAPLNSAASAEYSKSASRKRVLFILGPILFILFIIHLLSPSSGSDSSGSNGRNHLPGFGPRSSASRRTDRINAARQRQKSAASGKPSLLPSLSREASISDSFIADPFLVFVPPCHCLSLVIRSSINDNPQT